MKYLPKEKTPESLYNKALRAFKNIQNDNGKFVICLIKKELNEKLKSLIIQASEKAYLSAKIQV